MPRAPLDTNTKENAYQASAIIVSILSLLVLVAVSLAHGKSGPIDADTQMARRSTPIATLPEFAGTRFDLGFGRPELALP